MKGLVEIQDGDRPLVCIAGPTASGKSGFALDVARAVDGEVVNADALQVYAGLQTLSARPTESEMDGIRHHLYGHVDGGESYSAGHWVRDVIPVIEAVWQRGRVPVLCGGTGLYFQALLQGLAEVPSIPEKVQAEVEALDVETLQAEAASVDPEAFARILGEDPQRLARIVAVYRATGKSLSDWQADTHPAIEADPVLRYILMPDRDALYARIEARFDVMMDNGALDEARRVRAQGYPARAPMLKAIGLSHLLRHLEGEFDLDQAIGLAKRDTRRLAKRQMTWFRNRCSDWTTLSGEADRAAVLAAT